MSRMNRGERGSTFGYFLAALLGALLGGWLVAGRIEKTQRAGAAPSVPAPIRTVSAGMPGPDGASSVAEVVRKVGPSVVSINTRALREQRSDVPDVFRRFFGDQGSSPVPQEGQGSGMIIDGARGYVLTNAHVVKGATSIKVTLKDKRTVDGKVIGADPQSDLAVVKISANNLPRVSLSHERAPEVGSWVVAIGNPFGFENTVTVGVVSATERNIAPQGGPALERLIQTDAAITPGNSGGPLVNLKGEVVGINTAILSVAQGIGFAISSEHANTIAQQLIDEGKVVRPWIGVEMQAVRPELKDYFDLPVSEGVMVSGVVPNSPAAKVGLERGDVIVEVNRIAVKSPEELRGYILKQKVGGEVSLLIYRGRESKVIKLRTAEFPANLMQR